jgi:hypothetical protein
MDYVNIVHVFQKQIRILQYWEFVGMQNHYNRKQILKRKNRMARTIIHPNKFKVSHG